MMQAMNRNSEVDRQKLGEGVGVEVAGLSILRIATRNLGNAQVTLLWRLHPADDLVSAGTTITTNGVSDPIDIRGVFDIRVQISTVATTAGFTSITLYAEQHLHTQGV